MPVTAVKGASRSSLPAEDYFAVTPSDTDELAVEVRGLIVAVGGALKVVKPNGVDATLTVPAGTLPIGCKKVYATGTTATGITGLV